MALMIIAERRRDVGMAEKALGGINTAFETMCDAGNAPGAATFEQLLPQHAISSRSLRER